MGNNVATPAKRANNKECIRTLWCVTVLLVTSLVRRIEKESIYKLLTETVRAVNAYFPILLTAVRNASPEIPNVFLYSHHL